MGFCLVATAQMSVPLSLESMVASAGIVVHGKIAATETGKDPVTGLAATWVTMDVIDNLLGASGSRFTFKQYGGVAEGYVVKIADAPRYVSGDEAVFLLYPPSKKTGFQSPVGMGQGMFRVTTSSDAGAKRVEQLERTMALAKSQSLKSIERTPDGAMDLNQFKRVLRMLIQRKGPGRSR